MSGPLEGLRVVEFAEGVAGPMTGRLLGDAGADVIKAELSAGDRSRGWGSPDTTGVGVVFQALNRNKRSVVVESAADPVLSSLLAVAEVLIVDSTALDVEATMAANPALIVCVVSGWGPKGPWAELPGSELAAQLASEATSSLGRIGEEPVRIGADLGSTLTASFACQAIAAALLCVDEVGGQRIDVSLLGSLLETRSALWTALSDPDEWWGFHLDNYIKPPENGYRCKDGLVYMNLARVDDMDAVITELGLDSVRDDPRWEIFRRDHAGGIDRHAHLVHDMWDRGLADWSVADLIEVIRRHGGWISPYLTYQEFADDPQSRHMGLVIEVPTNDGSTIRDLRPPWQFTETPASVRRPPPGLGEHDKAVREVSGWS